MNVKCCVIEPPGELMIRARRGKSYAESRFGVQEHGRVRIDRLLPGRPFTARIHGARLPVPELADAPHAP
jgi:hypothetical protein